MTMTPVVERIAACLSPEPAAATDEDDFARKPVSRPELIPSAVLFPIVQRADEAGGERVLLTRRSDHLRDHPGQISFPGGRVEASDPSPLHAALREAREEIGLDPALPRILGYLPAYRTATGFLIYPVVALIAAPFSLRLDEFEVAEAFEAPLAALFDPRHHRREHLVYQGRRHEYNVIECEAEGKSRYIWGATAGMILALWRRAGVVENTGGQACSD
ncbi:MAG: CoA pyrophosphatase [Zoogloeaceae bacterium]|nr:CoA pyrophosphatase [Zoogloeaceae bacterium]